MALFWPRCKLCVFCLENQDFTIDIFDLFIFQPFTYITKVMIATKYKYRANHYILEHYSEIPNLYPRGLFIKKYFTINKNIIPIIPP